MKIYTNQKTQFENGETFRRLSRDSEVILINKIYIPKCSIF